MDFIIDSTPPSTPTISNISPRDGSIQFDATVDEESPYLKEWLIRYQEDDGSDSECSTWSDAQETTASVSGLDTNSQSLDFTATNGVDYAFCVIATDDANNQSAPSETQKGTARDECDFIECYPGELQTDTAVRPIQKFSGFSSLLTSTKVAPHLEAPIMLSITALMLSATLGTTTPGGWSFGLHAGPFDPSISMTAQFGTITTTLYKR